MGRFRDAGEENEEPGIDMSPLIDCVFILLIFFIVTTVFVEETGVEVDKPQAAAATDLEKNSILIAVTEKGDVIYDEKQLPKGGVQSLVRRLLQKEDMPVIIQADKSAKWEHVARVIDEAKLANAKTVNLSMDN